jgi:cobalt-precorrin-5B (C1)-methyltransferase
MRNGFSTSACAAASASAAIQTLITGQVLDSVTINLPALRDVRFQVFRCEKLSNGVLCGVIKDAGDDAPDVTHGLEIQAQVEYSAEAGIVLKGGKGVGVATLSGLPIAVGEAAINPVPRRLIRQVIQETLKTLEADENIGLSVTIHVPDGERVAGQTMNPKLGIIGGISILGTDGLVRPYSAPAFRASIFYGMNVARQAGYTVIGISTGKRSAAYLQAYLQDERGLGVVEVGDELDYPLQQAPKLGFERVVLGGMIGKFSKLAQGRLQTHVKEGEVNFEFLAEVAASQGAPDEICQRILAARTAHQVQGWLQEIGIRLEPELARRAAEKSAAALGDGMFAQVLIFSLDGELLGQFESGGDQ